MHWGTQSRQLFKTENLPGNTDCERRLRTRSNKWQNKYRRNFLFVTRIHDIFSCRVACSYWRNVTRIDFNWKGLKHLSTSFIIFTSISRKTQGFWLEYVMKGLLTVASVTMILLTFWLPLEKTRKKEKNSFLKLGLVNLKLLESNLLP